MKKTEKAFNIYKLDIELLMSSFTAASGKQQCILNMPYLKAAVSDFPGYLINTRASDNMAFRQIRLILGADYNADSANPLIEYIVYVAFNTLNNAGSGSGENARGVAKLLMQNGGLAFIPERATKTAEQFIFENGFSIDYGEGRIIPYKRFEKSGSMAKACVVSFASGDLRDKLAERIVLLRDRDRAYDKKQLEYDMLCKWNAYKGLALTSAEAVDLPLDEEAVIVIKDGFYSRTDKNIPGSDQGIVITAAEVTAEEVRELPRKNAKSQRVKEYALKDMKLADFLMQNKINQYDGVGLISFDYASNIESQLTGLPSTGSMSSFQFRLPFCKGMLHKVDFKRFYKEELGQNYIIDVWGGKHDINRVEIILTESQFKAKKWLVCDLYQKCPKDAGGSIVCDYSQEHGCYMWKAYWRQFAAYNHKLCISQYNKPGYSQDSANCLNYQVIHTLDIDQDGFKAMLDESMNDYWSFKNDARAQLIELLKPGGDETPADGLENEEDTIEVMAAVPQDDDEQDDEEDDENSADALNEHYAEALLGADASEDALIKALRINVNLLREPNVKARISGMLISKERNILSGRFPVNAHTLYLAPDLLRLLLHSAGYKDVGENDLYLCCIPKGGWFYAPALGSARDGEYSIIRNPHISRNEHVTAKAYIPRTDGLYTRYLSHLTGVCMINPADCFAERLSGADYDGDIVKVIDNPKFSSAARHNLPWIKIPEKPGKKPEDEGEVEDEWQVCLNTFKNEIGKYSNYAFGIAARAYGLKSAEYEKQLNLMTILIGLEIDSAKSGVKPFIAKELKVPKEKYLFFKDGAMSAALLKNYNDGLQKGTACDTDCRLNHLFETMDKLKKEHKVPRNRLKAFNLQDYITPAGPPLREDQKRSMLALALAYRELSSEYYAQSRAKKFKPFSSEQDIICKILEKQGHVKPGDRDAAERLMDENSKIFSSLGFRDFYPLIQRQRDEMWAFTERAERPAKLRRLLNAFHIGIPKHTDISFYTDFNYGGYDLLAFMLKRLMDINKPQLRKEDTLKAHFHNLDVFGKRLGDVIRDKTRLTEIKDKLRAEGHNARLIVSDAALQRMKKLNGNNNRDDDSRDTAADIKLKFIQSLGLSAESETMLSENLDYKYSALNLALSYEYYRRRYNKALLPYLAASGQTAAPEPEGRYKCALVEIFKSLFNEKVKLGINEYIKELNNVCRDQALKICGGNANMAVDLCLDGDINAVNANNCFFWIAAGELAVENKRIKPYYEYMYPQLADEGDYTYMFQKYKTGGEFR